MRLIKGKSDWIVIILTLCIIQIMSFWCIDVSVSAMISKGTVTNGIFGLNPMLSYHIGLYTAIISLLVFGIISVHHVLLEVDKNDVK